MDFQIGDRVQMTDAKGAIIRGRVNRVHGRAVGVVFQRGWFWPDGTKERRSDFSWHFSGDMVLNDEPGMVLSKATTAVETNSVGTEAKPK